MSLIATVNPVFWLVATVGFLVLETATISMVSVWFAAGAAAALLSCIFIDSFRVQAVIFVAVSALCLLAFRPLASKLRQKNIPTNGDRNIGREALALTAVTFEATGRVRLDGVDWNARCAVPGDALAVGDRCRIAEIHSTMLIVEPILTENIRN